MQQRKWMTGSLAVAVALGTATNGHTQPGQPLANGQGGGQQGWQQWQQATPAQRQQMILNFMETQLRQQMTAAGFADKALQDPIIVFWKAQETARQPLRDKTDQLMDGLRHKTATDDEVGIMMRDVRDAVSDEKTRHDAAIKDLDAQLHYTKNPRLEAMMTMMGLIGDEISYSTLAGTNLMLRGFMAGTAGRGGPARRGGAGANGAGANGAGGGAANGAAGG